MPSHDVVVSFSCFVDKGCVPTQNSVKRKHDNTIHKAIALCRKARPLPKRRDPSPRTHHAQGKVFKLSSNESVFGASPHAIEAGQAWLRDKKTHIYPTSDSKALRAALSVRHGLPEDQLICGNGSDELISLLIHAYCGVSDEVVMSRYGFIYYRVVAQSVGAKVIDVDEDDSFNVSHETFLRACTPRTKLMFIANPNNPTGFVWQAGELEALAGKLPEHVLLVVDAAYAEYAARDNPSYQDGSGLVGNGRCVMLRTFSKLYGLSALRIGWGYMPRHVIDTLAPLRPPFNVNQLAQVMATASLSDDAFYTQVVQETCARRDALIAELGEMNHVRVYPSGGNFLLLRWADEKEADTMAQRLSQQGLIVRQLKDYRLSDCLRVTVGSEEAMSLFVAAAEGNMFKQLTIIGGGLMGSSLALAVRARGLADKLVIVDTDSQARPIIAEVTHADRVVAGVAEIDTDSDCIIVAVPVGQSRSVFADVANMKLSPDCVITDVGSVKATVVELRHRYLRGCASWARIRWQAQNTAGPVPHKKTCLQDESAS